MAFDISGPPSMSQLVERATTSMLVSPDWTINIQICDMCARDPELAREAVLHIKKKLKDKSTASGVYALHLLEALMKNAWYAVPHVHHKDYLASLARIVKDKKTKYQIKDKLADLIQSWGIGFQSSTRFPDFFMTYQSLRHAGVTFHPPQHDYAEPPMPAEARVRRSSTAPHTARTTTTPATTAAAATTTTTAARRVYVDQYGNRYVASTAAAAPPTRTVPHAAPPTRRDSSARTGETKSERTARVRSQLEPIRNKFQLLEDLLTCTDPEHLAGNELIAELFPSCLQYHDDVMRWIERGNVDDLLMGELLSLNDQMTAIQQRYENLQRLAEQPLHRPRADSDYSSSSTATASSSSKRIDYDFDDDASDLALPPPPGQHAPPLLLDADFISRPLPPNYSSQSSSRHDIPVPDSLEAFLSRPPLSPSAATSSQSSLLDITLPSPAPAPAPAQTGLPVFAGFPLASPLDLSAHAAIPQGVAAPTGFFPATAPAPAPAPAPLASPFSPPLASPFSPPVVTPSSSSFSFFDMPAAAAPNPFVAPTTSTSFFDQQPPAVNPAVAHINPWDAPVASPPNNNTFNPFNL